MPLSLSSLLVTSLTPMHLCALISSPVLSLSLSLSPPPPSLSPPPPPTHTHSLSLTVSCYLRIQQPWSDTPMVVPTSLKMSIFDVSDSSSLQEVSTVEMGIQRTSSIALDDHRAFLYDDRTGMLVLPVSLYCDETAHANPSNDLGYMIYDKLCTIHCALCTIHCSLCTMHCSLCTNDYMYPSQCMRRHHGAWNKGSRRVVDWYYLREASL
jgi:hypothetical protein